MVLILEVLQVVAPVFILASIGLVWVRAGWDYNVEFVTRMAMTLSVPCLIFVSLMNSGAQLSELIDTAIASAVSYFILLLVFWGFVASFKMSRRTYLAPLVFGNTGNLGLPLALFAFGDVGFSHAVVVFAVMALMSFSIGLWIVSGGGSVLKMIKEPMVWGTLGGGVFMVMGWQTPLWMTNSLSLIGQMAIPLMLITLGVALARLKARSLGSAFWISLIKAIVCVLISLFVGDYYGLPPVALAVLVMQVATPVAVTSYLLAEKYGADSQTVASLVVASTVLSVLILPLILGFAL